MGARVSGRLTGFELHFANILTLWVFEVCMRSFSSLPEAKRLHLVGLVVRVV